LLPTREGAAVMRALAQATDRRWRRAWTGGRHLSMDQARADALHEICTGGGTGSPELVVTVDAGALVRGETQGGEVCEIGGVGPVPVATARSLLGEAFLTICVTDGTDVRTVTSTSRVVPTRVRKALALRDPACVVPGCGQRSHLEIDHWRLDFSRGGLTALDNLCRLCAPHHRLKTRTGWRLEGGPGRWRWLPPRARQPEARAPV
nr:HNH endonuclease signature motif containing protein [Actinomycetota bacterium]